MNIKALKIIKQMVINAPEGTHTTSDLHVWKRSLEAFFGETWGCLEVHQRVEVLNFVLEREMDTIAFAAEDFEAAWPRIARRSLQDDDGVCVDMWRLLWEADADRVSRLVSQCLGDTPFWSACSLSARVGGKSPSQPRVSECRVIVPLGSCGQLCDVLLSNQLRIWIDGAVRRPHGAWIESIPRTQSLDTSHAMSICVERMIDNYSPGGLAQCDILTYYDGVPLMRIMEWLEQRGMPRGVSAACIRI